MIRSEARIPGISWVLAFMAATIMALAWAPTVMAQQVDQYGGTTAPAGPAAGAQCTVSGDADGVVNSGDTVTCGGEFDIAAGASVTLEDSDGTQGTFVDGENANITEGSIIIEVTGEPFGVVGGNGVLNTDGLFVVATMGIFAADDEVAAGDDAAADDSGTQAGASTGDGASAQAGTGGGSGDGAAAQASTGGGSGDDTAAQASTGGGAGAVDDSAGSGSSEDGAAVAVLPDTGGSILAFVLAGGLLLIGAGFVIRRLAGSN